MSTPSETGLGPAPAAAPGTVVVNPPERLALTALPRSPARNARRAAAAGWAWAADYTRARTGTGAHVAAIVLRAARAGDTTGTTARVVAYWRTGSSGKYVFVGAYRWRADSGTGRVVDPIERMDAKELAAELERAEPESVGGDRYGAPDGKAPDPVAIGIGGGNDDEEIVMPEQTIPSEPEHHCETCGDSVIFAYGQGSEPIDTLHNERIGEHDHDAVCRDLDDVEYES